MEVFFMEKLESTKTKSGGIVFEKDNTRLTVVPASVMLKHGAKSIEIINEEYDEMVGKDGKS